MLRQREATRARIFRGRAALVTEAHDMGSNRRDITRLFSLLAVVALLVLPSAGLAGQGDRTAPATVSSGPQVVTQADQDRIRAYWTPARMAAARPMSMPDPGARTTTGISREATGAPGSVAASRTDTSAGIVVSGGAQTAGHSYPFPFTRFNQENQAVEGAFPYMAAGKMFFSQNGGNFVCSAASAPGNPTEIAWTAGHCLSNGAGIWSTNVLFVPAHRPPGSVRPYGTFPGGVYWTTSAWHFSGDLTADLGAFTVGTNAAGQSLRSRVGYLGFARTSPASSIGTRLVIRLLLRSEATPRSAARHRTRLTTPAFPACSQIP